MQLIVKVGGFVELQNIKSENSRRGFWLPG